jgi:DNA-binding CsgD family transcriptional regulator
LDLASATLEATLDGRDPRPDVCGALASVLAARGVAHVRHVPAAARTWLCLWRVEQPGVASVVTLDLPEPLFPAQPDQRRERGWWQTGAARSTVLEWLDQPHLAELPLAVDGVTRSLVVAGRPEPFTDAEADALVAARRLLIAVDRVLERHPATSSELAGTAVPPPPPLAPLDSLTAREHEVLTMLSEGLLARSIAQRLAVSERTVHKHLGNLYKKLDAHDRLLAVRKAEDLGLLPSPRRW